jgi:MerR HTH family regulatory protein
LSPHLPHRRGACELDNGSGGRWPRIRACMSLLICGVCPSWPVAFLTTAGGRRRYTRRQLALAARVRELFDQGHTLAAAQRILELEDDLAAERALTARLHEQLGERDGQDN